MIRSHLLKLDKVTVPYVEVLNADTAIVSWFALPALIVGSEGRVSLQRHWDRLAKTKNWLADIDVTFLRGADLPEFEIGIRKTNQQLFACSAAVLRELANARQWDDLRDALATGRFPAEPVPIDEIPVRLSTIHCYL